MDQLTVKDVIEALKELDPHLPIVSSSDEEGNSYSEVFFHPTEGYFLDGQFIDAETVEESFMMEDDILHQDSVNLKTKGEKVVCIN